MICSLIKILASNAFDNGTPLPGFARKHTERCAKCRAFVEAAENLEIMLPAEAESINLPEGLAEGPVVNIRSRTAPVFIAVAAVVVIMLAVINKNQPSITIDSLSMESATAVNEILDDPELAGIFTGSLIQGEIDAIATDVQAVITSWRSLVQLTP